jgi:hypothetical protein
MMVYTDAGQFFRDIGVLPAEGSLAERLALTIFRARVCVRCYRRPLSYHWRFR